MYQIQEIEADPTLIDRLHKDGHIEREAVHESDDMGGFYLFKAGKKSALAVAEGDRIVRVVDPGFAPQGVKPRDKEQLCMMWGLHNMDLTVVLGAAGTGKTTLSIAYALQQAFRHDKNIVLSKPSCFVGGSSNAIAAVPGDAREKIAPYVESYMVPMRRILGDHAEHYLAEWEEKGRLMFQPLELIRGMHFEDTVVILDEAQNTTPHELMSFISRVGEGCTCIIMGDSSQIDADYPWRESGLYVLLESNAFFDDPISCCIRLKGQYRGPLAALAAEVLEEFLEDDQ
jgi:predicted ribonuclease YlaK